MAIAANMSTSSNQQDENNNSNNKDNDEHDQDMVMPGFRFHPTEEELIEFYLRRKVEGKRFNVELITFLDLYRYDPWELPALAAIGEKEWYFYVPRDRKYRNGDRPNRVTTSGYWKATGADRMIRTENFRSIGLKKTLVFYSGKAPKGIRTSWIMNEYRLPHHETERLQKAEISLCRVYKRAGVEDHPSLPRLLPTRTSSSSSKGGTVPNNKKNNNETTTTATTSSSSPNPIESFQNFVGNPNPQQIIDDKVSETSGSSTTDVGTSLGLSQHMSTYISLAPAATITTTTTLGPDWACVGGGGGQPSFVAPNSVDDLHRLVNYQQYHHHHPSVMSSTLQPPLPQTSSLSNTLALNNVLPPGSLQAAFNDRLWDWNAMSDQASKDYNNAFK